MIRLNFQVELTDGLSDETDNGIILLLGAFTILNL